MNFRGCYPKYFATPPALRLSRITIRMHRKFDTSFTITNAHPSSLPHKGSSLPTVHHPRRKSFSQGFFIQRTIQYINLPSPSFYISSVRCLLQYRHPRSVNSLSASAHSSIYTHVFHKGKHKLPKSHYSSMLTPISRALSKQVIV